MKRLTTILAVLLIGGGCYNLSGANQEAAEANAKHFIKKMNLPADTAVSCVLKDSDGDGYVSCTFNVDGEIQTFECAGKEFVRSNTGCRTPKLRVPTAK